jgi:pyridoxal phosphate enzyme (YggS family)
MTEHGASLVAEGTMPSALADFGGRLAQLRSRIADAARQAGRAPQEVQLLPVSKGHPTTALRHAADLGLRQFGESYVSEVTSKIAELSDVPAAWVYLGPIQSNKTRPIAEQFDWVLGLTSGRVARRLAGQRPEHLPPLQACIQVNADGDPAKSGIAVSEIDALLDEVDGLERIEVRGLMTIPMAPEPGHRSTVDRTFAVLAELFAERVAAGRRWDTLSMGMSGDFEIAVARGSTQVRLGTALFGPRRYNMAGTARAEGVGDHV